MILEGSPLYWLGVFSLAAPWVRFPLGDWVLYPGQWALGLLLAAVLLDEGGWVVAVRPLAPLLALGAYVSAVAALRGEWTASAIMAAVTVAHFWWGAAAMRLGMEGRSSAPRVALLLGLTLTVGVGVVMWVLQAFWPEACRALNCHEHAPWPFTFTGGWGSAAQYALLLLLLLAPVGGALMSSLWRSGGSRRRWALPVLGAAAGLGLVAGSPLWGLLLAALGWVLLYRRMGPARQDPQRLLLRGLAAGGVFAVILVYGLVPGYLHRLWGSESALPPVRVTLPGSPPNALSSDAPTLLAVELRNVGWSPLGGSAAGPLVLGVRYLVTPERGPTRVLDGEHVAIPGTLRPGESRDVMLSVRLPPWMKDGYLTWRLELQDGSEVPLARRSLPGFRFHNPGFRRLALDPENLLTAMADRARSFRSDTEPPPMVTPDMDSAGNVVGDALDTLFFSPLWGEREPSAAHHPFTVRRPFLLSLLHRYGLIGLGLVLWFAWRLLHRSMACAERGDPAWMLLPLSLLLLFLAGLFTPALGSYYSHWAFFLLAGFLEGRYARKFPWPALRLPPRRAWRVRLPLPRRMGAPRRSHAGRVHR